MSKQITTNFYPIHLEFDEYNILQIPNRDGLKQELRNKHNSTHSFFKIGDFIYASNKEGEDLSFGGKFEKLSVFDNRKVTSSLIKHLFFRTFKETFQGIIPIQFYPFRILSRKKTDDLIYNVLPIEIRGKIAYKKQIEIQLRLIDVNDKPTFGFIINMERKWIFNINCQILRNQGFNLLGRDIIHSVELPGMEGILAPDESFIGIVKEVYENTALIDTNEGNQIIPLNELYIKKTTFNIKEYLNYKIGEKRCNHVLRTINSKKEIIFNAKNTQREIQQFANLISINRKTNQPIQYVNKDGFVFTISSSPEILHSQFHIENNQTFILDPSGVQTCKRYPDIGLNNFGPYDSNFFSPKSPTILAIFHKDNRGFHTNFLNSLLNGMPKSKWFKQGFKDKYNLHGIKLLPKQINSYNIDSYENVISSLEEKPDIAIIELPSKFRSLPVENSPYYLLKARLLEMEVPVQFISTYNAKNYKDYILNPISLQLYAKLGGIPWVLPASTSIDREFVVGIGHSTIRKNSFKGSEQERIVGITTFFSGDGQYLLSNKAKDVPYDKYFDELLKNMKSSFDELSRTQAWKDNDTIRLIFHIFKPIKNIEFDVVSQLIRDYPRYNIQFAFVTISKKHPFILFNPDEKGKKGFYGSELKGEYVPRRGTNLILNDKSCLIQLLGVDELKTTKHGMSSPILIRIRKPEGNDDYADIESLLFTDLHYIVQQIVAFTHLSWRTFLPGEIPATMQYSNLISGLLGRLRRVEGWKPDSVNRNLKYKKWFL